VAFQYSLEALLRLQRSIEQQAENRLLVYVAKVATLQNEARSLEQLRWQHKQEVWTGHAEGTPAAFLRFAVDWDELARRRQQEILEQLKAAETARLKQLAVYRAARQKREILEGLKDSQKSAYTAKQLRKLQESLDQTYLLRSFFVDNS
jgi:hypothetical protein